MPHEGLQKEEKDDPHLSCLPGPCHPPTLTSGDKTSGDMTSGDDQGIVREPRAQTQAQSPKPKAQSPKLTRSSMGEMTNTALNAPVGRAHSRSEAVPGGKGGGNGRQTSQSLSSSPKGQGARPRKQSVVMHVLGESPSFKHTHTHTHARTHTRAHTHAHPP